MSQVCILTDSTAQFATPTFPGYERVTVLPFHLQIGGRPNLDAREIKLGGIPFSAANASRPVVTAPTVEEFAGALAVLSRRFAEIVVILVSAHLSQSFTNAQRALQTGRYPAAVCLVDSQTTSVGLGLLVQAAAEAAVQGQSGASIHRLIRGLLPHIYSLFCVQSLTYLASAGHLDPAQAIVGEMLGITPFFILENGLLTPIQKARSSRHLVDQLHEFVAEFDDLKHVAIIQGTAPMDQDARALRERIAGACPTVCLSEHSIGASVAALFGPRTLGIIVMEKVRTEFL